MNFSGVSNQGRLGQLLRWPLKLVPKTAVVPIIQGPLKGKRWIAGSSSHGCWLGSYEFEKQQQFIKHIRAGDVIYDIGAHVGFYTLLSSQLTGSAGRVIAFEPYPPNIHFLNEHIKLNQLINVTLIPKAVSDRMGQTTFEVAESTSMGHLSNETSSATTIVVNTVALDQFIIEAQLPLPDVLKVDIEGAEFDFLQGARQLLETRAIKLFLATHGHKVHEKCLMFLQTLGYEVLSLEDTPVELCSELLAISPKFM
jgi:FkbM family methyltransferase